jgi:nucleoside-diphosphate-sugar epimerase
MKALITGASGFVGFELTQQLLKLGHDVIAAVGPVQHALEQTRRRRLKETGVTLVDCDLRRPNPLAETPSGWNVLFHLAAYVCTETNSPDVRINDEGTRRLFTQLNTTLEGTRVVYASSIAVSDSPHSGIIRPDTPCRPRTCYGRTKLAGEAVTRELAPRYRFQPTVIRFPTIYGPGFRPNGMFDSLAKRLPQNRLWARIAWPGKMSLLDVRDLAGLLIKAAEHPATAHKTFLASSGEDPTTSQIAQRIAECVGAAYRPLRIPRWATVVLKQLLSGPWQAKGIPYALQIATWRASLLTNGLYCDGRELTELLGMRYRPWQDGFAHMYAEDPRYRSAVVVPLSVTSAAAEVPAADERQKAA